MTKHWPRPSFYVVMALAIALDQLTKAWIASVFQPGETMVVLPGFFNLTYVQNQGIAFGMFQRHGLLIGVLVGALALAGLYYSRGIDWSGWEPSLVGGCLCGGAIGNLADRLRLGYVVDFFDAHLSAYQLAWPVFNVADSLICVSVGWIVMRQFWSGKKG